MPDGIYSLPLIVQILVDTFVMTLMVSEKCEGKILWFIKQFGLTSYLYFYVTPAMLHTSHPCL